MINERELDDVGRGCGLLCGCGVVWCGVRGLGVAWCRCGVVWVWPGCGVNKRK